MVGMPLDELRVLLARHARPDLGTGIAEVRIFRADRPSPPTPTTYGRVLALVAQGTKRFALGDRVYEYQAGDYLVASIDLPVTAYFARASPEEPALGFGLTLHPAAVAEVLLQADPADLPAPAPVHQPAWPSAEPPSSCSTPPSGCCACSTSLATFPCSRP